MVPNLKSVILCLFSVVCSIQAPAYTIIIDPGHGGNDMGATKSGVIESKITLQVALKLAAKLEKEKDTKVILTRQNNSSVSLQARTLAAEQSQADLFVSLHGNSSSDFRARGAEFYFGTSVRPQTQSNTAPTTALESIVSNLQYNARLYQSQYLAFDTFNTWKKSSITQPRAIKQAPFYVVNKNSTPSILVEIGFITNHKESQELLNNETQERIAQALQEAVATYREKSQRR